MVDLADAVRPNIESENANPDGIHWGWDAHIAVADAMLEVLRPVAAGTSTELP
jgi:hypothetical protein